MVVVWRNDLVRLGGQSVGCGRRRTAIMRLTDEQQQEIKNAGWPPEFTDPATGAKFVLIPKEMFDRVLAVLEQEDEIADVEEMYPLVAEILDAEDSASRESA